MKQIGTASLIKVIVFLFYGNSFLLRIPKEHQKGGVGKTVTSDVPVCPQGGIFHYVEGADLMPASIELFGLEVSLVNAMSRETILRQYIDSVKRNYNYVLIDCIPSLGMMTVDALAAAETVLIPVQAEYLPVKGLEQLQGSFQLRVQTAIYRKVYRPDRQV
jgi:hypothetical protein